MKSVHLLLITLIGVALLLGCSKKEEPTPPPQANEKEAEPQGKSEVVSEVISQAASDAESKNKAASLDGLTYVKGDPVTFENGKVYVVEFWATWCPPCLDSIPHLTGIQKQFKDKGVTVIGISNEQIDTVKKFVEKMGQKMDYTVAVDAEGSAIKNYMEAFNQRGIPTAFIVDGKGNIAWVGHPMDRLDTVLEKTVSNQASAK